MNSEMVVAAYVQLFCECMLPQKDRDEPGNRTRKWHEGEFRKLSTAEVQELITAHKNCRT